LRFAIGSATADCRHNTNHKPPSLRSRAQRVLKQSIVISCPRAVLLSEYKQDPKPEATGKSKITMDRHVATLLAITALLNRLVACGATYQKKHRLSGAGRKPASFAPEANPYPALRANFSRGEKERGFVVCTKHPPSLRSSNEARPEAIHFDLWAARRGCIEQHAKDCGESKITMHCFTSPFTRGSQ
jgi:hypothetical protein